MNYTQALSPYCTGAGQHENEFSLVLHEVKDVEIGAGVYVSCPKCNESALLEGVESLAEYFAPYATDDIFRLNNYGVISWKQAVTIVESREAAELEEGHASCMKCAGVFPAATETHCAWCGADVTPKKFVDVCVTRVNQNGTRFHVTDTEKGTVTYYLNKDVLQVVDVLTDTLESLQDVSVWAGNGTAGKMIQAEIDRRLELHWKRLNAEHKNLQGK